MLTKKMLFIMLIALMVQNVVWGQKKPIFKDMGWNNVENEKVFFGTTEDESYDMACDSLVSYYIIKKASSKFVENAVCLQFFKIDYNENQNIIQITDAIKENNTLKVKNKGRYQVNEPYINFFIEQYEDICSETIILYSTSLLSDANLNKVAPKKTNKIAFLNDAREGFQSYLTQIGWLNSKFPTMPDSNFTNDVELIEAIKLSNPNAKYAFIIHSFECSIKKSGLYKTEVILGIKLFSIDENKEVISLPTFTTVHISDNKHLQINQAVKNMKLETNKPFTTTLINSLFDVFSKNNPY